MVGSLRLEFYGKGYRWSVGFKLSSYGWVTTFGLGLGFAGGQRSRVKDRFCG